MVVLVALTWISYVLYFVLATVCLASGLYYLAEFVEEYTVFTKNLLKKSIFAIAGVHVLLLVLDDLPYLQLLFGIAVQFVYYQLLHKFPVIELTDFWFLASCGCAVVNHCTWFIYFANHYYPFKEILAFFFICVWMVPFGFFISLSANENALPGSMGFEQGVRKKQSNRLLSFFSFFRSKTDEVLPATAGLFGPASGDKLP
mmetsp:Transcript_196/g.663  ORF Transcript_196/g.663 Transcript_196/m.663 type:complete len:201 (+) Transcript_196:151-753(+)|eukprot:CAMPEP_0114628148 /NCGR_PEP_ID=MMETSP0168-20121206/12665_1 /TAXON_ID=95228 ORGANISM="Vannella sp., Strain DIVA3 517/6/12" /NCGR_SAMPLE_ID=MMETSP0168 /ASSEMBLY_ACC=CAM_ASM_000044 /LENGTH=200 /DNA_ID=CAMNT_0001839509 /DNA_START=85 /DNA_END=687 /DNA_ORIENTATION=-